MRGTWKPVMLAASNLGLRPSSIAVVAFVLADIAGMIHLLAGMQQMEQSTVLGWGMMFTALAQFAGGALVLVWPSAGWARALLAGTAVALAIFAVQHTVGIPILDHAKAVTTVHGQMGGQDDGHLDSLAFANLVAELALTLVLLPLALPPSEKPRRMRAVPL